MLAEFKQAAPHKVTVVLKPEDNTEAMLLAQWLRYDENGIVAFVRRNEKTALITECELSASSVE